MQLKNVEDIYPLSPMQETMLFHACTNKASDLLFNQVCFEVDGALDEVVFQKSWQAIVDRHAVLRTAFVWQGLKKPQQIVRSKLKIPFDSIDFSNKSSTEQTELYNQICQKDRNTAFSPEKAPLIRIKLVKLSTNLHYLIWSSHHLILDRWSIPIVFNELVSNYQSSLEQKPIELNNVAQFKRYISWIHKRNEAATRQYWLQELSDYTRSLPITRRRPKEQQIKVSFQHAQINMESDRFNQLKQFCKLNRLTLATFVQGAWALLLNQLTGSQDVVFGVVVSGRPAELAGVEDTLGSFVNNLPVRVKLDAGQNVIELFNKLQSKVQQRAPFEYVSLSTLQSWCELPPEQSLFDTILLWLAPTEIVTPTNIEFNQLTADMATAYPLTLTFEEKMTSLVLAAQLQPNVELTENVQSLLQKFVKLMLNLITLPENTTLVQCESFKIDQRQLAEQPALLNKFIGQSTGEESGLTEADRIRLQQGRETVALDVMKEYLQSQWQQVLNQDNIPYDSDFFEIGGDSLKAVTLLTRIEQAVRKKIPLLSLFKGRNINEMAHIVLCQDWPLSPGIATPINVHGIGPPLYCIASPEVNTIGYANLSTHLNNDLPLYILQDVPENAEVRQLRASELPALARKYIRSMQKIQPQGPYHILGMCTGAQLSIEIGRQLEAMGQGIGFMGMINTWAFFTVSKRYYLRKAAMRLEYYKRRLSTFSFDQLKLKLGTVFSVKSSSEPNQAIYATQDTGNIVENSFSQDSDYSLIKDVGWPNLIPDLKKLAAEVTVFRLCKQPYWRISDPSLGWNKQAEKVNIVNIAGDNHLAILREPDVQMIAKEIMSCIERGSNPIANNKTTNEMQ